MEIVKSENENVVSLSFKGRLDAVSAPDAEKEVNSVLEAGSNQLLINLKELEYISSAGLRVLLVAAKGIRSSNGKIVLCSLSDNVKEVFEISGFSSIFNVADSEEDALKNFD